MSQNSSVFSRGKTVLLCVTGCIAAYKACEILRALQYEGVRVRVMMTAHAAEFVGPATFEALTGEPVLMDLFGNEGNPIPHIEAAKECDALLIAPCTANAMAKIEQGIADDLLTATVLACAKPIIIAPAMNTDMLRNRATQLNMSILRESGITFVGPVVGDLACGSSGDGHLADPDDIADVCLQILGIGKDLAGRRLVITAGPTYEPLDAVRYIANRSSGKMGYAIAEAAALRGARVTLVSGPTSLSAPPDVSVVRVESAQEMLEAARTASWRCDAAIFAAAVCDVRPENPVPGKLKKGCDELSLIRMEETPDVMATVARDLDPACVVVGFAAETDDMIENARQKLRKKRADLIVANDVSGGAVFGSDDNKAVIVRADSEEFLPLMPKTELANKILDAVLEILGDKQ